MKLVLVIFNLFFLQLLAYAQCSTCTSFEAAFINPKMVVSLKVNSLQTDVALTKIPSDMALFTNLKTLWLTQHNFVTIGNEICKLDSLESISLADDMLTDLPDCIYEMKNLKEIILTNNAFSEIKKQDIITKFKNANPLITVTLN